MFTKFTLLVSLLAATPLAYSVGDGAKGMPCLNPALSKEQKLDLLQLPKSKSNVAHLESGAVVNIDTYIHIVSKSQSVADGYLSRDTMNTQMRVLNDGFAGTGFAFTLRDIDWTINANWAANYDEMGMKYQLRKGDYRTLNLYFLGDFYSGSGYCYYPISVSPGSEDFYRDGCTIGAWTTPGRTGPFSTGRIATHEVGHWSGLIHTFEGNNCSGPGDYVDDTPAQSGPSSGCPTGRDSCPGSGLDPIHNHMDYTDDVCRTEFTPGQIQRMADSYNYYRR